jgi:hypothetical protein
MIKRILNSIASLLLLFNGIGAFYGGWNFINYPDGSSMQIPLDLLKHTPFTDYFIPGIVLFITNGVFSLLVLTAQFLNYKYYPQLISLQGLILSMWILIQILLIQTVSFLHMVLGAVGIALIALGALISTNRKA